MNPTDIQHVEFNPDEFSGQVRMFPIPNLVMFPHVVQPLHIFEERYRELMQDALATDHLIAMPVLKSGWEPDYAGRPPVEPWACLGKVVLHNKLPDGCFNLLLMGVGRLRIEEELPPLRSFRQAKASLVDEQPASSTNEGGLHSQLTTIFEQSAKRGDAPEGVGQLLENDLPLQTLTDLMAYALPLSPQAKLKLLAEANVRLRAEFLIEQLGSRVSSSPRSGMADGFPPFSVN